eukprot:m.12698 g.12698  ORF g.12698 m.12698 type:complete len:440 (+) comp17633_c0_seq2:30-1349(+)
MVFASAVRLSIFARGLPFSSVRRAISSPRALCRLPTPFFRSARAMASSITTETCPDGSTVTTTTTVTSVATITTTTTMRPHAPATHHAQGHQQHSKAQDKDAFVAIYHSLAEEVITEVKQFGDFDAGAIQWFKESLDYNCVGGKMNRGLSVLDSYRELIGRSATPQEVRDCQILGWCVEWLQAFFLVADDLMDNSITRRGQPCWYQREGVGTIAVNDSFLIEGAIYRLLKKNFSSRACYLPLIELMHEVTYQTELGQMLDLITAPPDKVDFAKFSLDKYKCIVRYKTAFYSFYLPVAMAMILAGVHDQTAYANAKEILLELGEFFQIQDDYLDCYGDPKVIGKIGTDIQDNKCGWLVIQALRLCNADQRKLLEENYARHDDDCVARVKQLYKDLNIEKVYHDYEEESYQKIMQLIDQKHGALPKAIFIDFAQKIYKRAK